MTDQREWLETMFDDSPEDRISWEAHIECVECKTRMAAFSIIMKDGVAPSDVIERVEIDWSKTTDVKFSCGARRTP